MNKEQRDVIVAEKKKALDILTKIDELEALLLDGEIKSRDLDDIKTYSESSLVFFDILWENGR